MSVAPVVIELDFAKAEVANRDELRAMISHFEEILKQAPQIELPLTHHYSHGVYGREMQMPKAAIVVGKIHKHRTMNVITRGHVSVISQDGVMHLFAGDLFVSTPGAKRVIYAHEDSAWTCILGTTETDPDKIEKEFIVSDYSEVVAIEKQEGDLCLSPQPQ